MRRIWPVLTATLQILVLPSYCFAASASETTLVTTVGDESINLQVPVSAISLTFPKDNFRIPDEERTGAQAHPRYFHFVDDARGLAVSGWIESAAQFQGFDKFWVGEFSAMKKSGVAPSAAPTLVKAGEWVAAAYDVSTPGADAGTVNTHVRAELLKDGTWVDMHISVTGKMSSSEARAVALGFLNSIAVLKK